MSFHGRVSTLAYGGLAQAADEGDRIGSAVDEHTSVVMLENHGVIVIGNDAAEAWSRLYFLERACEVQILAQSTGQELIEVPDDIVQRTAEQSTHDQSGRASCSTPSSGGSTGRTPGTSSRSRVWRRFESWAQATSRCDVHAVPSAVSTTIHSTSTAVPAAGESR